LSNSFMHSLLWVFISRFLLNTDLLTHQVKVLPYPALFQIAQEHCDGHRADTSWNWSD